MSDKKPVKILFTIPNFRTAGSRHVLYNCVTSLDRERFEPRVAVLSGGGDLADRLVDLGIPVFEAPFCVDPRPYASLPIRVLRAARHFRPVRPEIWHSFHYRDDYTEPMIARASGTNTWLYTKKAMGWGSRGWLLRSYLATRIVVDNREMTRTMFSRWGLRNRHRLIPHGVVFETFADAEQAQPSLRDRLGIAPRTPLVVSVAELVPVKGHLDLIRAHAELPDTHLVLAGRGLESDHAHSLVGLCQELRVEDRVHLLGHVQDIPALLREADVFVLATRGRGEGCPVALLEAMASGVACIATDVPGSREILADQRHGRLVPPEDPRALAREIANLCADRELASLIATAAQKHVFESYTVDREVEALERLYGELSR